MSDSRIIELVEYQSCLLDPEMIHSDEADYLFRKYRSNVTIDWPSPKTNNQYKITAQGWVGYLGVPSGLAVHLLPKTGVQNLFGMMEYAYDLKSFKLLEREFESDPIKEFFERIASIFAHRVSDRIRIGLYREYIEEHSPLAYIRGRMDIASLSRDPVRTRISCYSEDQTLDAEENQIIAWTMFLLVRSGLIQNNETLQLVRKVDRTLRNAVSLKPFHGHDCQGRTYNRLNSDYELIHKLCRFFLEHAGPTQKIGDHTMIPFIVEMPTLFESFVARWLQVHIDHKRYRVERQKEFKSGEALGLKMFVDIVVYDISSKAPLCVIDTKYKVYNSFSNDDYYQVIAYADALGCDEALLVYPEGLARPMDLKPGNIRVRSLSFDLCKPIEEAGRAFLGKLYAVLDEKTAYRSSGGN